MYALGQKKNHHVQSLCRHVKTHPDLGNDSLKNIKSIVPLLQTPQFNHTRIKSSKGGKKIHCKLSRGKGREMLKKSSVSEMHIGTAAKSPDDSCQTDLFSSILNLYFPKSYPQMRKVLY